MTAQEDVAGRLAEIRARYDAARAVGVGFAIGPDVPCLLSVIDSLTAERDGAQHELRIARFGYEDTRDQRDIWRTRAEAAEADRERLREALSVVHECAEKRLDDIPPYPKRIDEMNEAEVAIQNVAAHCCGALVFIEQYARAALATPPSEEGTNND